MKKYIYVDYENMNNLKEIPNIPNVKYFFFVGAKQNSIPKSLVLAQNNNEVKWIDINGTGKNALDFYIVYYLAKNDTEKDVFHYILSKDTGFDPLIKTINKNHNLELVKRIENLSKLSSSVVITKENNAEIESEQKSKKIPNENYEKVLTSLKKIKKNFPKTEKTLKSYIQHSCKIKELSDKDVKKIIEVLLKTAKSKKKKEIKSLFLVEVLFMEKKTYKTTTNWSLRYFALKMLQ